MAYSLVQPSLAGGEISPSLYGRIDLEKYQTSLRRCRNFIVRQSGGIENRPGFRFLGSAKYADRYCRLIPFQFSVSQTYALELGDHYFRVWSNGALVTDGGSPVEVATPWPVSVISELKFTQSADVMTVCHNDYPPLRRGRLAHRRSDNNQRAIPGPEHRRLGNCVCLRPNWIRNVDCQQPDFQKPARGKTVLHGTESGR